MAEQPTPNEQELAELRAKAAAFDTMATKLSEPSPAPSPSKSSNGTGCILMLAIPIGLFALVIVAGVLGPNADQVARDQVNTAPTAAQQALCNQEGAYRLAGLRLNGPIIVGQEVTREGVILIVNTSRWRALGLEKQKRWVAGFDCGISGPGNHLKAIRVRADRNGPDLFTAEGIDLLNWREQGYANTPIPK